MLTTRTRRTCEKKEKKKRTLSTRWSVPFVSLTHIVREPRKGGNTHYHSPLLIFRHWVSQKRRGEKKGLVFHMILVSPPYRTKGGEKKKRGTRQLRDSLVCFVLWKKGGERVRYHSRTGAVKLLIKRRKKGRKETVPGCRTFAIQPPSKKKRGREGRRGQCRLTLCGPWTPGRADVAKKRKGREEKKKRCALDSAPT